MKTYRWKAWSGAVRSIEAHDVIFQPGYIVFLDADGNVVLAVQHVQCSDLHPDTEPDPKWWS